MSEFNIVGDVAGRYDTLLALLVKMPDTAVPFSVGDMIDRGPKSKQVVEFFMTMGKAVLGNHEHFLLDAYYEKGYYETGLWVEYNGGFETLQSFNYQETMRDGWYRRVVDYDDIPKNIAEWIAGLPLYHEEEGLFISHAPVSHRYPFEQVIDLSRPGFFNSDKSEDLALAENTIIWNREEPPKPMPGKLQVYGHNPQKKVKWYYDSEEKPYAVGVDTGRKKVLTGLHWPSLEVFEQEWLEPK